MRPSAHLFCCTTFHSTSRGPRRSLSKSARFLRVTKCAALEGGWMLPLPLLHSIFFAALFQRFRKFPCQIAQHIRTNKKESEMRRSS
jgi:hypothetical protein